MTDVQAPVNVGDILAGKWRVEAELGSGAMGVVYAARHVVLGQRVALKFLHPSRASNPTVHERFLREARAAANLKSHHVARVSDVATLENGLPYIVMELLDGCDLSVLMERRQRLPIGEAVDYLLQVCDAVGEAHRQGIVHRDLKPANLFLTHDNNGAPLIKVLDFGVSKVMGDGELKLTATGSMMGSPLYMSFEQMEGSPDVDARADIWALGVILYELVAGLTPFSAPTLQALSTNVLAKPPMPLGKYLSNAPAQFEAVLLRCMDKDRDKRFPDVGALVAALAPFSSAGAAVRSVTPEQPRVADAVAPDRAISSASRPARTVTELTAAVATTTGATTKRSAGSGARSRQGRVAGGLAAAFVAATLALVGIVRSRTVPSSAAASSVAATLADATAATVAPAVPPPSTGAAVVVQPAPGPVVVPTVTPTAAPSATATSASARVPAPSATPPGKAPMKTPAPAPAPPSRPGESLFKR